MLRALALTVLVATALADTNTTHASFTTDDGSVITTDAPVTKPKLTTTGGSLTVSADDIEFFRQQQAQKISLAELSDKVDGLKLSVPAALADFGIENKALLDGGIATVTGITNGVLTRFETMSNNIAADIAKNTAGLAAVVQSAKDSTNSLQQQITAAAQQVEQSLPAKIDAAVETEKSRAELAEAGLANNLQGLVAKVNALQFASPADLKAIDDRHNKIAALLCQLSGGTWSNNDCTPPPGYTKEVPASSCKSIKSQPSGPKWIRHADGGVRRVYCDNDWNGGGWELLMKIDGSSTQFQYDSSHWKSGASTHNPTDLTLDWGKNAKYDGFNKGRYGELYARWRDPHARDEWAWSSPGGWSSGRSPQSYFNSGRHICCSRYYQVEGQQEWRNSGGRFSNQGCAGSIRINQCTAGHACARWGFHWNNECGYGSNDAGGGIGLRPRNSAKSAGDWVSCCQRRSGRRRDFDVFLMGR